MALQATVRTPRFKVFAITRNVGELFEADLDGSVLEVVTQKRMGDPAGSFRITLAPRRPPAKFFSEKWTDIFSPMDYVEILARVPPRPWRVVMRGWLDTVGETFSIESGQPQHQVLLAGRDYGKIVLMSKLWYPHETVPQTLTILQRWADGFHRTSGPGVGVIPDVFPGDTGSTPSGSFFRPQEYMRAIYDAFYSPQEEAVVDSFPSAGGAIPRSRMVTFPADPWEQELAAYNPLFSMQSWTPFTDVWTLFRSYQNLPWHELYFVDEATEPHLVFRQAPWLDFDGAEVQEWPPNMVVHDIDEGALRMERQVFRSDAEVKNLFFTSGFFTGSFFQLIMQMPRALEGMFAPPPFRNNPYLIGLQGTDGDDPRLKPSVYQRFGFRQHTVATPYLSIERGLAEGPLQERVAALRLQGADGNRRLVRAFGHAEYLEAGTYKIPGDERLMIGDYLRTLTSRSYMYVAGLLQQMRQGTAASDGHFWSTIEFVRGRMYIDRASQVETR